MSYIGRNINNLSDRAKLDSISTSATATFNLLLNSVAYVPSSAESLTVSLNGVIQAPQSSYTVSGSTIIFASNLASSDVINFILAERAITLSTIGSGTVTTTNIVDDAVTSAKVNLTDELHINSTASGNTLKSLLKLETDGQSDGSGITIDTRTAHTKGEINFLDGPGSFDGNYVFKTATGSQLATPAERFRVNPTGVNVTGIIGGGANSASADLGVGLHIKTADSGASVNGEADDVVVEGSGYSGMTILSGTGQAGAVMFGDSGDNGIGRLTYDHSNNSMQIFTSGSQAVNIDTAGHFNLPKQSGFQAKTASKQSNLAINAFVTLLFATEISDTNADYNASNSTFTAPVTGKYLVTTALNFDALDHDSSYWQTQIKTSNREYTKLDTGNQYDADPTNLGHSQSMVVDMDANDTCIIRWFQGGGTAQADLRVESFFAMQLLA